MKRNLVYLVVGRGRGCEQGMGAEACMVHLGWPGGSQGVWGSSAGMTFFAFRGGSLMLVMGQAGV